MNRREFIRTACATTVASTGCLTSRGSTGDVVLPPPEDRYTDPEDLPYPAHGEEFPSFTLPDPVTGVTVNTEELDRTCLATAVYTTCPAECSIVGNRLAGVQSAVDNMGLTDDTLFVTVSFDPRRDDAEALRDYGKRMGVDFEAGNWRFLLPEDEEEARRVVDEKLGIGFKREGGEYIHLVLTFLVNPDGYVERAYRGERIEIDKVSDDVQRVSDEYY